MIHLSLLEFTRRLCKGGGISVKGIFLLPVYYLQIIPALPFAFLQFLIYGKRIDRTVLSKDPVFIIGHYRSGTTLLQKLLASNRMFGFLTNYDALFPNTNLLFGKKIQSVLQYLINKLSIKNPFFHDSILNLSEATEEDDYLMNKASAYSAYWGLIFPRRWREWLNGSQQFMNPQYCSGWKKEYLKTVKYATFRNNGKQLILKNPPNTERISTLLEMFPQAKFIYLYRNPLYVYYSVRNMWKRSILRYYSLQHISDEDLDEIIFGHYVYLTEQYEKDKKLIPGGNLIEISYEELKSEPFVVIQKIYSGLNLPDFESASSDLRLQLEKEKNYRNFQYRFDEPTLIRITEKWGKYLPFSR